MSLMAIQFHANWNSCLKPTPTCHPKHNISSLKPIKASVFVKPNTSSFLNAPHSLSEFKLNHRSRIAKLYASAATAESVVAEEAPVDEKTPETAPDTEVQFSLFLSLSLHVVFVSFFSIFFWG